MIKISCDYCEQDLTFTTNCMGYGIKMENFPIQPYVGAVTAMMVNPPLESSPLYFCGIGCLRMYLSTLKMKGINDE